MFLGDSDHEFVKKQLKDEGWGHKDCVEWRYPKLFLDIPKSLTT
jgi:hypothetical protein